MAFKGLLNDADITAALDACKGNDSIRFSFFFIIPSLAHFPITL